MKNRGKAQLAKSPGADITEDSNLAI